MLNQKNKQLLRVLIGASALICSIIYGKLSSDNELEGLEQEISQLHLKDGNTAKLISFYESGKIVALKIGIKGFSRDERQFETKRTLYKEQALTFVCQNQVLYRYLRSGKRIQVDLNIEDNSVDIFANLNLTTSKCGKFS